MECWFFRFILSFCAVSLSFKRNKNKARDLAYRATTCHPNVTQFSRSYTGGICMLQNVLSEGQNVCQFIGSIEKEGQ